MGEIEVAATGVASADSAVVLGWIADLPEMVARCTDDAARIDLISALESMKGACAGSQAALTYAFCASQVGSAKGRAKQKLRRSACGQVALARRESPHHGGRHVGLATALHEELQHTREALEAGRITEWQATVVCRETACLSPELRAVVDEQLAPQLGQVGDKALTAAAARLTAELDAESVVERAAKAAKDRRVSIRPAPDSMCYLTSLLPVGVGVAAYAALNAQATAVIGTPGGDPGIEPGAAPRSRGQVMSDLLVKRLTGGAILGCDQFGAPIYAATPDADGATAAGAEDSPAAHCTAPTGESADGPRGANSADTSSADTSAARPATARVSVADSSTAGPAAADGRESGEHSADRRVRADEPVDIHAHLHIVMSDATLFGSSEEPAEILGYGPVPAELARRIAAAGLGSATTTWFRRFYTDPDTGQLAAMESRSRYFPESLKQFLLVRDQHCRIPFCEAPGRHADHVSDHALGGPTTAGNGQMTSADCNFTKQAPGWTSTAESDGTITVTTPTGHQYHSRPPDPPGISCRDPRRRPDISFLERRLGALLIEYDAA